MAYRFLPTLLLSFFSTALISVCLPGKSFGKSMAGKSTLFIQNNGQVTDQNGNARSDIDFKLSAANGLNLFIGKGALHYQWVKAGSHSNNPATGGQRNPAPPPLDMYRMDVQLIGANPDAVISYEEPAAYSERYYLPSADNGLVAHSYGKVTYHDVYPHIDWVFYFNAEDKLEHDFVIYPGGKTADIKLQYAGATSLKIGRGGCLNSETPLGNIIERSPYAYERGSKKKIASSFVVDRNMMSFLTEPYNGTLVIDPILEWGTLFGGDDVDYVKDVTIGKDGFPYYIGATNSVTNIATSGAFQVNYSGGTAYYGNDAFISKFDLSGDCLWSTYYGGTAEDVASSISVDTSGNLYIGGFTKSTTGMSTTGSYQIANGGNYDAFIAKFDTSGQRIWGTYFGGPGAEANKSVSLHCDGFNNIYLTGQTNSTIGIATAGAYQSTLYNGIGQQNTFIAKFNTSGSLIWSTYYGGNVADAAYGITNDTAGNVYITGNTNSSAGIASTGSQQPAIGGAHDAFVAKFDPSGNKIWSTYFGGTQEEYCYGIACDEAANIYITGSTVSTSGVATTGAHQTIHAPGYLDGMIAKFNTAGTLQWATYYGGIADDNGDRVICAANGDIYISGYSSSDTGISTPNVTQPIFAGFQDGVIARFSSGGTLVWGSYIGQTDYTEAYTLAGDASGNLFIGGNTMSTSGITTSGAWQGSFGGGDYDGFMMRIKDCIAPGTLDSISGPTDVCAHTTNSYTTAPLPNATGYVWILPSGWTGTSTTHTITVVNDSTNGVIKVFAFNDCITSDTISLNVVVNHLPEIPQIILTSNVLSTSQPYVGYQWNLNGNAIPGATSSTYQPTTNGNFSVTVYNTAGCSETSADYSYNATGINSPFTKNNIIIYPNPAGKKVFINTPVPLTLNIYNIEGRMMLCKKLKVGENEIDLSMLTNGMYAVSLQDTKGNPMGTEQLVKTGN